MTDDQLRVKTVQKLARKRVVGSHKRRVDTVKNWFATSDQGRIEDLIREMIRDPTNRWRDTVEVANAFV